MRALLVCFNLTTKPNLKNISIIFYFNRVGAHFVTSSHLLGSQY